MVPAITASDLTSLFVQDFIKAQNNKKMDPEWFALRLKSLCLAKKTDTFKGERITKKVLLGPDQEPFKGENGNTFVEEVREDVVIYSKPMEDNATRLRALQMALNIRGIQTTSPTTQVNIDKPGSVNLMGYVAQVLGDTDGSEIIEP